MIIVLKKKTVFWAIIAIICVLILVGGCLIFGNVQKAVAAGKKIIVIDAGHGGVDKGVVGKNGTIEAEKNLEISKMLENLLSDAGFVVVMTRTTADGLYDSLEDNFKSQDFLKRKEIIEKANPDMLISIHCNKFPSSSRRGIQTFYNGLSESGRNLAEIAQEAVNGINMKYTGRAYAALNGEYFMLNCTDAPSVIVECGFLSNAEDEALLCDAEYLDNLVYALYGAIVSYYES